MTDKTQQLEEEIVIAEEDAADSHKIAMNSYAAGYDRGYVEGLMHVKRLMGNDD